MSDKMKTNTRHGPMGSELISRELLPDSTVKVYSDFESNIKVGIHPDAISHKEYSSGAGFMITVLKTDLG